MNNESSHSGPEYKWFDGRSVPTSTPQVSMTLREYYAGLAMQAILVNRVNQISPSEIAALAVTQAEHLIAVLSHDDSIRF